MVVESILLEDLLMPGHQYHVIQNYPLAVQLVHFLIAGRKNHHLVSLLSFQAFGWLLYGIGDGVVRKQHGFAAFPIIARGSL